MIDGDKWDLGYVENEISFFKALHEKARLAHNLDEVDRCDKELDELHDLKALIEERIADRGY